MLCETHGYAHFTVSNVEGSGLPNEATYELMEGLVRDTVTGLVWETGPSSEPMSWDEAKAHCDALEVGGRDDFRLPGRIELVTILDFSRLPVAASPFTDVASDYHFTSSPAPVAGSAYSVYFGAGETAIGGADPGRARARCVAGAVARSAGAQFAIEDTLVRDVRTGLVWDRTPGEPSTWGDALARCAANDARLPSIRELQSILDETRDKPALDVTFLDPSSVNELWSDTLRGTDPWLVDFADGETFADRAKSELLASRCVR